MTWHFIFVFVTYDNISYDYDYDYDDNDVVCLGIGTSASSKYGATKAWIESGESWLILQLALNLFL